MSGIFDKIKEKKAGWDRSIEEKKVADIQKQIDNLLKDFKKSFEKKIGKMGLSISYLTLSGADARQRNAGVIIARFNDGEGYPITVVQTHQVHAPSGAFEKQIVYPAAILWGTITQGAIPFTVILKEIDKGFMKGKARVFLPLTSLPPNEKELLLHPGLQEPVVAALNADKKLVDAINSRLALSTWIKISSKRTLTISCGDMGGKCVMVPAQDETAVFLRTYGDYGDPKAMLEMLSGIRRHILAHAQTQRVSGKIPAPVFKVIYALCKAKSPEPSSEAAF